MSRISILLIFIAVLGVRCNWADKKPFCNFPQLFPVTMETSKAYVDVDKYMGTWYEIARTPHSFQKNCICSEATYEHNRGGKYFLINNKCLTNTGDIKYGTKGKAYPTNENNTKSNLYMGFILPGNYWILDIDPDYEWVVIGGPCRDTAWIMSRSKSLSSAILTHCFSALQQKGYDTSVFVMRDLSC